MGPWSMAGLVPLQVYSLMLLHTHTRLGRNNRKESKPTLMGGWEEGVHRVGRPVTIRKCRHDSYFTSRAVTYQFQFSNQRGGRLVVAPRVGRPLTS